MDKLKNFKLFVKENNNDILDNQILDISEDEILKNIKELPSEMWTVEMIDANRKFEIMQELENIDENDFDDDDEPEDKKMLHKKEEEITEKKYSELQDYEIKNVFEEEENEQED